MFPASSDPAAKSVFDGDARDVNETGMAGSRLSATGSYPRWLWRHASTCQRDRPTRTRLPMRV